MTYGEFSETTHAPRRTQTQLTGAGLCCFEPEFSVGLNVGRNPPELLLRSELIDSNDLVPNRV